MFMFSRFMVRVKLFTCTTFARASSQSANSSTLARYSGSLTSCEPPASRENVVV